MTRSEVTRGLAASRPGPADVLLASEIIRELEPGLVKLTLVKCRASSALDLISAGEKMTLTHRRIY